MHLNLPNKEDGVSLAEFGCEILDCLSGFNLEPTGFATRKFNSILSKPENRPKMVTLAPTNPLPKSRAGSLGYDFALLGLKGREARVDVIRVAAERTASKIPDTLEGAERVEMLAELASSTYRLLDPRRRTRSMERVQLSMASENDPLPVTVDRQPLVAALVAPDSSTTDPLVVAEIVLPAEGTVQLASKVTHDSVSQAGEEKPPRKPPQNSRHFQTAILGLKINKKTSTLSLKRFDDRRIDQPG